MTLVLMIVEMTASEQQLHLQHDETSGASACAFPRLSSQQSVQQTQLSRLASSCFWRLLAPSGKLLKRPSELSMSCDLPFELPCRLPSGLLCKADPIDSWLRALALSQADGFAAGIGCGGASRPAGP